MLHRAARITAIGLIAALVSLLAFSAPAQAAAAYWYAQAEDNQNGTGNYVSGMSSKIWIANPYLEAATGHTLAEMALADAAGDRIEMGWVKDNATGNPYLFITYGTAAGGWCGTYVGGAGTSCPLYVDNSSNPINSGSSLSAYACNTSCTTSTTVKAFQFYYTTGPCGAASAGWFFYFDGSNVGCIPPTAFPGGFTTGSRMLAYGEVAYSGGGALPCTDMGTGSSTGSVGASGDAYFSNISYVGPTNPVGLTPNFTLSQTNAAAYSTHSLGVTGNKSFTFGGAGGTGSPRITPGVVGSC